MPKRHHSRRHRRRSHKKTHRRRRHQQRGGSSCAAMPMNRESFQQRGGMAPIAAGDALLLSGAARAEAGIAALDQHISELPGLVRQGGGARSRRHKKQRRSNRRRRTQRGGALQAFNAPYTAGVDPRGLNAQWVTEASVNSSYKPGAGAQA